MDASYSKSNIAGPRPLQKLYTPSCSSGIVLSEKSSLMGLKCYEFKPKSFERILRKNNYSCTNEAKPL
jgi:hypothetical protein